MPFVPICHMIVCPIDCSSLARVGYYYIWHRSLVSREDITADIIVSNDLDHDPLVGALLGALAF